MRDATSYADDGQRMDKRFWIQDRLRVTNVMDFSQTQSKNPADSQSDFALKKLQSYGFHKTRCIEALSKNDDDFGLAFEHLMKELFELEFLTMEEVPEDLEDQKNDEKMAIQSIYGENALVEKISGKLWELRYKTL